MDIKQVNEFFVAFHDKIDTLLFKIKNPISLIEIGIIAGVIFFACFLNRIFQKRFDVYLSKKTSFGLTQRIQRSLLSFTAPIIAFVLIFFAMGVSFKFNANVELYILAIKLTLIWFAWIIIIPLIPDLFVRTVICCTLLPFLVIYALGLSEPFLEYLNSLAFSIAGIPLSLLLLLKVLLIGTCLFWFARLLSQKVVRLIESQREINPEIRDLLENIFQVILYSAVVLITLDLVGIDLKSFSIIGGAIGIGIGFGLQKIAANFISGIIILFEQNVRVGHMVELQGEGNGPGWIRHLGARAAIIDTGDGKELLVPNEVLLTKTVIDWTSRDRATRTNLLIKVSFQSNLEKAKEIMLKAVLSHPNCSKLLAPSCYLEKFTDNGAQFLLQFWVDDLAEGKMDMQNDILMTIWKKFAEEHIEHPVNPLYGLKPTPS